MPYIPQVHREKYDRAVQLIQDEFNLSSSNAGQLNYLISKTIQAYTNVKGYNYQTFNDIIGALEGAKLELYRREVAPYEEVKIKENGDI